MFSDYKIPNREFCAKFAAKSAKLDQAEVDARRARVMAPLREIAEKTEPLTIENINKFFSTRVLNTAVDLIDEHFFDGEIRGMFAENRCCFSVCMENRCTTTGGKCWTKGKVITIKLSSKVFQKAFKKARKNRAVGRVPCDDILSCLVLILEHELVHALISCDCRLSGYFEVPEEKLGSPVMKLQANARSGHSKTFMAILNNRFGHTEFRHTVFGERITTFKQGDIKVGDIIGVRQKADFPNFKTGKNYARFNSVEVAKVSLLGVRVKLTDKGTIRGLYGRLYDPVKHKEVDLGVIPYENIISKNEPQTWDTPERKVSEPVKVKQPPVKKQSSPPKPVAKKNTVKKPLCNKRNPAPPCPEGMTIKKRPNGEECCYKSAGKPVVKTKKVSPVPKPVAAPKPVLEKPVAAPQKDLKNLEPSFDFVSKPHSVEVIDSELNYKQLKPETRKYIDSLQRLKLNKKILLNTSDLFPKTVPNHLILKVGVKYLLVDRSGSNYVRYATKILNIPTPSKGFENVY